MYILNFENDAQRSKRFKRQINSKSTNGMHEDKWRKALTFAFNFVFLTNLFNNYGPTRSQKSTKLRLNKAYYVHFDVEQMLILW